MYLSQDEFEQIINDSTKRIEGDIKWLEDEDHSPAVEFRVEIQSDAGYPLFLKGRFNPLSEKLSYHIIHTGVGRIYGLDLGQDHRNPDGNAVGEKHKHRWRELVRDKEAYVPSDITSPATSPELVWEQFCEEAKIIHEGKMLPPPPLQYVLFFQP
jgi:hypothetical protein